MDYIHTLMDIWRAICWSIRFGGEGQQKLDKKGREFTSYSFVTEGNRGVQPKSVVVYTGKKGNITVMANISALRNDGQRYPRSVKFLLKNLNEEKFFLVCGKTRMYDHYKVDYPEFFRDNA